MKPIKTLQDLWSCLLYCPLCQDIVREIDVSGGPDETFRVLSFKKKGPILLLNCNRGGKYIINCLDNSIKSDISPYIIPIFPDLPFFFLHMTSSCKKCNSTFAYSGNLIIDPIARKLTNIRIEYQDFFIQDDYNLTYHYDDNIMLLSKHDSLRPDPAKERSIRLPLVDFDFSDIEAVIKKIKTYIVFS